MKENLCFWMVAPGEETIERAKATVASARSVGVFKEFHLWTDAPAVEEAVCHPLGRFEPSGGLYRFTFLRDAVVTLNYDYYVWLDPGTEFLRHPGSILRIMQRAPVHVPLSFDLAEAKIAEEPWGGTACGRLAKLMRELGMPCRFIFAAYGSFFIVHRHVAQIFVRLAFEFWHKAKQEEGVRLTCEPLLAYATQMLTGDPRRHHISHATDLWLPRQEAQSRPECKPAIVG